MALVRVKTKYQVTLQDEVRKQVRLSVGDLLETKVERGKITLTPKAVVDRDEYTPAQRRVVDARLARALEDVKQGRTYGPFNTVEEMAASIEANIKKARRARKKLKPGR